MCVNIRSNFNEKAIAAHNNIMNYSNSNYKAQSFFLKELIFLLKMKHYRNKHVFIIFLNFVGVVLLSCNSIRFFFTSLYYT